jgi:predicted nucleic acid-binding protein
MPAFVGCGQGLGFGVALFQIE